MIFGTTISAIFLTYAIYCMTLFPLRLSNKLIILASLAMYHISAFVLYSQYSALLIYIYTRFKHINYILLQLLITNDRLNIKHQLSNGSYRSYINRLNSKQQLENKNEDEYIYVIDILNKIRSTENKKQTSNWINLILKQFTCIFEEP